MIDQILPIVIDYKSSKKQSINEGLKGFDSFNKKLPFGPFFQSIIDSINPIRLKEAHFPVPNPNPNRFPIQSNRFGPPPNWVLDPPIGFGPPNRFQLIQSIDLGGVQFNSNRFGGVQTGVWTVLTPFWGGQKGPMRPENQAFPLFIGEK